MAKEASKKLGVPFGIIDLSLAPTPAIGDSVADILCEIGLERASSGNNSSTCTLKRSGEKGASMASSYVADSQVLLSRYQRIRE